MPKPKNPCPPVERITHGRFARNFVRGIVRFTDDDELRICELLGDGKSVDSVRQALGWPNALIKHIAGKHGLAQPEKPKQVQNTRIIREPVKVLEKLPERLAQIDRPNVLDYAKDWLIVRPLMNGRPARLKDRGDCFLLDGVPAGLDQVMRETYRAAKRNGVTLVLPNEAWCR